MWELDNQTPFEAERTWVRDKDGFHHWIIVVKATYDISEDGELSLSDEQLEPFHVPQYNGADGESSLRYDADLVGMKPRTDVYLNGVAYAPNERPTSQVTVSFQVDQLKKELLVYGNKIWELSMFGTAKISSPQPFLTMPITYERAYGGFDQKDPDQKRHQIDFRNPVGSGVVLNQNHLIGKLAPNIEDPAQTMGKGWPAGFGAIASYWSPRKEFGGTYDDKWAAQRQPLLPEDYNPKCLLCAPLDQQVEYLKGGNRVELRNLTPGGLLRFTLPTHSYQFETYFGSTCKRHDSELVSVIIDSAEPRLIMVWQTSLPVGSDGEYLDSTVIKQKEQNQ